MRKVKRYTEWQSMPYKEKSQYDEFQIITTMANNAGIPKMIIDDAIIYHKKISEYELTFRGDNRDGILAASIYISCRINNFPRTAKEIANIFHLDATSATKGCKNALAIINNLEKDMINKDKIKHTQIRLNKDEAEDAGKELTLSATEFPPIVKLIGSTFLINESDGSQITCQIEIPRFKLGANFSFTLEAEGDASVFDFSGVALSDNGDIIKIKTIN